MSEQNENREKLLECAKKEFLEKGFNKASLRKITSEAGLTTGAVYFFFKDKEGLFGAVVQKPLEMIESVISEHFRQDGEADLGEFGFIHFIDFDKTRGRERTVWFVVVGE